jgi:hypothetical protein
MSRQDALESIGINLILISNLLLDDVDLRKLIYYSSKDPLAEAAVDESVELMNKNVRVIPLLPVEDEIKGSFIVLLAEDIDPDKENEETLLLNLRCDVLCPLDDWLINEPTLRPFLIMSKIRSKFKNLSIKGIGKLRLVHIERVVSSDTLGGYSMYFINHDFN